MAFAIPRENPMRGSSVEPEEKNSKTCAFCHDREAVTECDGCMSPLCKKCRSIEIWRTSDKEVCVRNFCPQCREDPSVNPHAKEGSRVFGLGQITDMVNQEQGKGGRFTIRIKIS